MTGSNSPRTVRSDDRGVSTAVTHVLAIGITAILISGLLVAAGGLLNDQKENAANQELKTIGNRIATQVSVADQMVDGSGPNESVVFFIDQPDQISGSSYSVSLSLSDGGCNTDVQPGAAVSGSPPDVYCLSIEHPDARNSQVLIPVRIDSGMQVVNNPNTDGTPEIVFRSLGDGRFQVYADGD